MGMSGTSGRRDDTFEAGVGIDCGDVATVDSVPPRPDEHDALEAARVRAEVLRRLLPTEKVASPKIGRFSVLSRIGHGGMGVVYAVYDEQLDRRVALEVIKGDARPELRNRLQREARAMARLSHPNVVPVFEVGEHEGDLFLVMEYVKGETLRAWAKTAERSAEEILDKYVQAGEGLAAAHRMGLVHRDFKPDKHSIPSIRSWGTRWWALPASRWRKVAPRTQCRSGNVR
jgi:predicted Ser/Thr protein kinase